jgi:hypothetical protein
VVSSGNGRPLHPGKEFHAWTNANNSRPPRSGCDEASRPGDRTCLSWRRIQVGFGLSRFSIPDAPHAAPMPVEQLNATNRPAHGDEDAGNDFTDYLGQRGAPRPLAGAHSLTGPVFPRLNCARKELKHRGNGTRGMSPREEVRRGPRLGSFTEVCNPLVFGLTASRPSRLRRA